MGRNRRPRRRSSDGIAHITEAAEDTDGAVPARTAPQPLLSENAHFEAYYRTQRICVDEQWTEFLDSLRSELPMAFRVNLGTHTAKPLLEQLAKIRAAAAAAIDRDCAEEVDPSARYAPRELPWFPHGLAWQWDGLCSWAVKKDPQHRRLKAYLVWLQGCGALTRQEAVSMIPPLCLDVGPDHSVLDLCAAPGSKASQILEMMHWDGDSRGKLPRGVLVANEIVHKRADVLAHSVNRLGSPCAIVTNVDAQFFPNLVDIDDAPLRFDRVLADVPCSGDGTLRKYPAIWGKWTPRDGLGLHHRQYTILCRGLDLLEVGGRLVYSTCSLNPIEDEAVVAAALRRYGGSVELLPLPPLAGLQGSPGLATWRVPHPDVGEPVCWERPEEVPFELQSKIRPSCFPAAPNSPEGLAWGAVCGHCRRFLPHIADSGGFFVAVLTKRAATSVLHKVACARGQGGRPATAHPASSLCVANNHEEKEEVHEQDEEHVQTGVSKKMPTGGVEGGAEHCNDLRRRKVRKLVPIANFDYLEPDDADWSAAASFLGVELPAGAGLCRRAGHGGRLFCVSRGAARVLRARAPLSVRVVCAGVRLLERLHEGRDGGPSAWRACQEGLPVLLRLGLRRRLAMSKRLLRLLLERRELELSELVAAAEAGEVDGLTTLAGSAHAGALDEEHGVGEGVEGDTVPTLCSGSVVATLQEPMVGNEETRTSVLAIATLLTPRGLEVYAPRGEACALLQTLDIECRTAELLTGHAVKRNSMHGADDGSDELLLEPAVPLAAVAA